MNKLSHRFLLYIVIGLIFGILDWFYLNCLSHISWGSRGESVLVVPIFLAMNYGIWLVPILPVAIYEARHTHRMRNPIIAGVLTWSCAIFSYYFYYAALLSLGKLVHFERFNIFGDKDETFEYYYWQMFKGIILGQFFEWIIIAVIGGTLIGVLSFWFFHKRPRTLTKMNEFQI